MYPVLKKCVSLFIVLTFLANQCLPLYAGQTKKSGTKKKTYGSQKQKSASDKFAEMQGKVSQKVEEAASQCTSDESCVNWAASVMEKVCKGMDCHLLWQEKFKWAAFNNQDPKNTEVKFQAKGVTYKMNLLLGARGYIRSKLDRKELFNEKGQAVSFLGYDKNLDELVSLISTFGVQSEGDRKTAFRYFSGVVAGEEDFCNSPDGLNRERCINQYNAVLGLAAVATTADSKAKATNQIYKLFKSYWPLYIYKDNQTIILENTFLALAAIDTDDSWAKINAIFTTDTQPTVMARGMEAVSIEFLTRTAARVKAIQTWGSTSYRNLGNADFAYVDTQEDKRQGTRTKSQKPYGNIIEDIGRTIAIEAGNGNPRAAKVASQAIAKANTWAKSRKQSEITRITNASFHWPFVVGILDGYYEFGEKFMYSADIKLLEFLRYGDFWDLNEGTQQRIRWKAWKYATLRQKKWKSGWYAPTLDKDKVTRSEQTATATKWASYADIALIVVGAAAALRKIGVISKGMSKCLSIMKKGKKLMGKNMNFATTAKTVTTSSGTAAKTGVVKSSAAAKSTSQGAKETSAAAKKGAGKPSASSAPKSGTTSVQGSKGGASTAKAGGKTSSAASSSSKGNGNVAKSTGNGGKSAGKKGGTTPSRSGNNTAKVQEEVTSPLDKKVQEAASQATQRPAAERLANPNAPKPDVSPTLPGQNVEKPTILHRAAAGVKKVGEYAVDVPKALWKAGTEGSQNLGIMPQIPSLNPFAGFSDAWKAVRAERQAATAATQAGETAGQATTAAQRAAAATGKTGAGIEVRGVRLKDGQTFGQVSTQTGRTAGQGAARTENVTATASQQTARVSEATKPLTPAQQAARERAAQSAERIAKGADDRVARLERQLDLAETESARQYHRALEADAKGYSGTVETANRASWNADKRAEQLRSELATAKKQAAAAHEEHQAAVARSEMGRPMASEQPAPRTTEPVRTESAKPSEPVKTEAPKPTEQASSAASAEEAVSREEAAVKRAAQHRDVAGERKAAARQQRREAVEAQGKAADDLREAQKAQKEAQESVKTAQKQTEAARKQYQEATERYRQATKKQGNAQQAAAQERYDELRAQVQQAREAEQEAYKDMVELGKEQKALEKDLAEASKRAEQAQDAAYQAKKDADAARKAADETAKKGTWTSAYKNAEANAQKAAAKAEEAQRKAAKAGERVKDIEGKIGEKSSAHAKAREKYDSAKKLVESRDEEAVALSKEVTAAEKVVEEEQALQKAQRASAEALADARQAEAQAVEQARQASEKVTASDGRLQEARKAIQQADAEIERADKAYKEAEAALSQRVKEAKQAAASSSRPATSAQPTQSTGRKVFTI